MKADVEQERDDKKEGENGDYLEKISAEEIEELNPSERSFANVRRKSDERRTVFRYHSRRRWNWANLQ